MEIKSEPAYIDVQVIDFDIAFPGDLQTYTVKPEDSLQDEGDIWTLTFASGGGVTFNIWHAHWYATRQRTIRVLAPVAQSATPTSAPPPSSGE